MGKNKRKFCRKDGYSTSDLLHYGFDHLYCSRILIETDARAFDSAGYLAHLGFELIMKANLLFLQDCFEDTHNLEKIYTEISGLRKKWRLPVKHLETIKLLDQFNTLRYPSPKKNVEIGTDDWQRFETCLNALLSRMPKSLQVEIEESSHLRKGNRVLMRKKIS